MTATDAPGWLVAEMAEGFQRLVLLRLEGSPSADSIPGVAMAWADAMMVVGIAWDEAQDVPRLKMAFRLLSARLDRWPLRHCPRDRNPLNLLRLQQRRQTARGRG